MKVTLRDLLDRLGVTRPMKSSLDTDMFECSDESAGICAMAEVRIESTGEEVSAELQFVFDKPQGDTGALSEVICIITARQLPRLDNQYSVVEFILEGKPFKGVYDWESKSCNFFRACVREIRANRIPDIELLKSRELGGREVWGSGSQGGSEKSPKINTQQLLYDYKNPGRGF